MTDLKLKLGYLLTWLIEEVGGMGVVDKVASVFTVGKCSVTKKGSSLLVRGTGIAAED